MTAVAPSLTAPAWAFADDFRQVPKVIRDTARAVRDALVKPGHPLRMALLRVPVQGRDNAQQNTRDRALYAQRFTACLGLLLKLLRHTDLQTNIVCRSETGEVMGYKMARIAEELGLDDRRLARAMHDLHAAGFIVSKRRAAPNEAGGFTGRTSVRVISQSLISLAGMATEWRAAGSRAYEKAKHAGVLLKHLAADLARKGRDFATGRAPAAAPKPGFYAPQPARSLGSILKGLSPPAGPPRR